MIKATPNKRFKIIKKLYCRRFVKMDLVFNLPQKIFRITKRLSYKQLILSWAGGFPEDPRSNVSNAFGSFSDESLLKCLYSRWRDKERTTCIERTEAGDFDQHPDGGYTVYGRLCRSKHHDLEQIDIGRYFEAHGPKPFSTNLEWYGKILDHLED